MLSPPKTVTFLLNHPADKSTCRNLGHYFRLLNHTLFQEPMLSTSTVSQLQGLELSSWRY